MGWFSSSSAESEANPAVVSREDRTQCWNSRDTYFACLDKYSVLEAGREGDACAKESKAYGKNCAQSWIVYFNKRRVLAERQKHTLNQMKIQNSKNQEKS